MRAFLFVILTSVAAILLWAVWTQSYVDSLVFVLSLAATAMCGYLISDYFFVNEKKTWQTDIDMYKKDINVLKEEIDILQKQIALAVPYTELEDLRKKYIQSEEEKRRINADFLAQVANIASLNTRLSQLQKEYDKFKEESTITSESRLTELEIIRDTLSASKSKLTELAQQNKVLKEELTLLQRVADEAESFRKEIELRDSIVERLAEPLDISLLNDTEILNDDNEIIFLNENTPDAVVTLERKNSKSVEHSEDFLVPELEVSAIEPEEVVFEMSEQGVSESSYEATPSPSANSQSLEGLPEDLKVVEGIGPKIELLLKESGIKGLKDLSVVPVEDLKEILAKGGTRYRLNDPTSWPEQARLLVSGEFDKFKNFTSNLFGKKNSK